MILIVSIFSALYLLGSLYLFIKLPKTISALFRLTANIILIGIINIVIWQPHFSTTQIKQVDTTPIILFDNSISMKYFNVDSSLSGLRNQLDTLNKFNTYFFGENVREEHLSNITFNDSISKFPHSFIENNNSKTIVLISDALCNNLHSEKSISNKSNLYYLPLKRIAYQNYCHFSNPIEFHQTNALSSHLPIQINGHNKDSSQILQFEITKDDKVISKKTVHTPTNSYSISDSLKLPLLKPGRHIIKIKMKTDEQKEQVSEALIISEPKFFNIKIHETKPSLDSRFFKLALSKRSDFKIIKNNRVSISVLFDNKEEESNYLNSKVVLYIGDAISKASIISDKREVIELSSNSIDFMNFKLFPYPSSIFYHKSTNLSPIITTTIDSSKYPILSKRVKNKKTYLYLYTKGFWSWDFQEKNNHNKSSETFTNSLLDYLKESLIKSNYTKPDIILSNNGQFNNIFNIYHPYTKPSSHDSVYIFINLKGKENLIYSNKLNSYLQKDTIVIPSLKTDITTYKVITKYGNKEFETTKTLYKKETNFEINSSDQNSIFLEKHYKKLDTKSIKDLKKQIISNETHIKNETIIKQIKLQRNWPFFVIVILLLTLLWSYKEN